MDIKEEINKVVTSSAWKKYGIYLIAALVLFGAGYVFRGSRAQDINNDDPRIQRIYDSVARSESLLGTLEARLKRVEQAATAGEAGSQAVISGIGTVIDLMEISEGRQLNSAANREAAAERAQFVEDLLRKVYQRESTKK